MEEEDEDEEEVEVEVEKEEEEEEEKVEMWRCGEPYWACLYRACLFSILHLIVYQVATAMNCSGAT